ncbi:alpha/beta hydrolase [Oerskovia sp. M15]
MHASGRRLLTPVAQRHLAFAQLPTLPERALTGDDLVARVLAAGAASPLDPEAVDTYTTVMRIPFAAHSAMEAIRWSVRSTPRPDGRRYRSALRRPLNIPTLQVHGGSDGFLRRELTDADAAAISRSLRFEVLEGVGHFLPEEAPDDVTRLLLDWLPSTQG